MKPLDELLIAWRDGSIGPDELKELERLLAEPGSRERLFEEFLVTATIAEALKVDTKAPQVPRASQRKKSARLPSRPWGYWAAAAVVLLAAGAVYLYATAQTTRGFEIVAGAALVDQKKNGPIGEKSVVVCEGNTSVTIRFPDGSTMDLAPSGSTVMHRRGVELSAGKASFQVQKVKPGDEAFFVHTAAGSVTVVGTEFSVELQPKGQSTKGGTDMKGAAIIMAVTVLTGTVSVEFDGSHYALSMGQSRAFGEDKETTAALPEGLKGFKGTVNGQVVSVDKDSFVLKMTSTKAGLNEKEVVVVTKDVKDMPELQAKDSVYAMVSEVEGKLVATKVIKAKSTKQPTGDR